MVVGTQVYVCQNSSPKCNGCMLFYVNHINKVDFFTKHFFVLT